MLLVARGTKGCSQGTYCFGTFASVRFATSYPTPYSHHSYLYLFLLWSVTNGTSRGGYCTLSIVVVVNPSLHNNAWATYIIVIKTLEKPSLSLLLCLFFFCSDPVYFTYGSYPSFSPVSIGPNRTKKNRMLSFQWLFSLCLPYYWPKKRGKNTISMYYKSNFRQLW